ncbi:MarR family transcriptional regulator [Streptomyces sp. CB00455]|uniref:MarR family winged helix-turn-helix transcriptional regulator n=1 Tax=Streptomyces sp. CB00455 TaxID=1703927 RepID=UPI00093DED4F|nr:MarR family winged helix-turn-helix transcriptional regulator [Streptomyces sp. CB00455]OKK22028.1 MarR family transcriptional regulator [Streptomyces sp. CB00455]
MTAKNPAGGQRPPGADREAAVETIQREMTTFARRARATAARMHPELSLVSFTLLSHLEERQGCRATDLAAHYALDKSTVSRQVAVLERAGLVERHPDPEDQRVHVLTLTPAGTETLAGATRNRRAMFEERLADWSGEDLERFAACLLRYNESGPPPADGDARAEH